MAAAQCIQIARCSKADLLKFKLSLDLSDVEHVRVVGARLDDLSILQSAWLLGLSHRIISPAYINGVGFLSILI